MATKPKIAIVVKSENKLIEELQLKVIKSKVNIDEVFYVDVCDISNTHSNFMDTILDLLQNYEICTTLPKRLLDPLGIYHDSIHVIHVL